MTSEHAGQLTKAVLNATRSNYSDCEKVALCVHCGIVNGGFFPTSDGQIQIDSRNDGSVLLCLVPSGWPVREGNHETNSLSAFFTFEYLPGPVSLRIVQVDQTLVVHASSPCLASQPSTTQTSNQTILSFSISTTSSLEAISKSVLHHLVQPLRAALGLSPPPAKPVGTSSAFVLTDERDSRAPRPAPPVPFGGDDDGRGLLVGPHHPVFGGGDPRGRRARFDPFGPPGVPGLDTFPDPDARLPRRGGPMGEGDFPF